MFLHTRTAPLRSPPSSVAAAAALRDASTCRYTASTQVAIHSQARLDEPVVANSRTLSR